LLIYLKPTLIGQEPADLLHYVRSNPAFPHEPTLDEFYSESQFEAYRLLGEHVIQQLSGPDWADKTQGLDDQARLGYFASRAHAHVWGQGMVPLDNELSKLLSRLNGQVTERCIKKL
ncbi:MAG: hypothetical protein JO249_09510, partial [Acidobacteria bacterium]|nr:hypothetical protein [Acidobacteriota bacterium]